MSKSSAGRFFYLTTRRNEKWFSGKSTSTKKDDDDGQGFKKKVYSQRVGAINTKKTPKTRKRTSQEHPEVTGDTISHVAYVAAAAMFAAVLEPVASIHGACGWIPRNRGGTKTLRIAIII